MLLNFAVFGILCDFECALCSSLKKTVAFFSMLNFAYS